MRKGYCLAILILLIVSSMALTASALPSDRWSTSRYSNGYGNENRNGNEQATNQMAQTQDQVTLTLYVLDGGMNGELLPGVDVTVYDVAGNSIGGVTDSKGSIVLNGQPGTWQFSLAKDGYKTYNLKYTITKSQVAATYLPKITQSTPSQTPAETTAYPQETAGTQPAETTQTAPTTQAVQSQGPVSLTIDVYETSLNGTALPGVQVAGQDAAGNSFSGTTDSNGAVILSGQPGTWQFSFVKNGYDTLNLNYNVTETEEVAAYLQRTAQPVPQSIIQTAPAQTTPIQTTPIQTATQSQSQGQIDFTVYVHEGDLNGTALSGVQVTGQDAAGNSFSGTTDSNGAVILSGQPGTWQFSFVKNGYGTLNLSYNVTSTDYGDVYLQSASSADQSASTQSELPVVSEVTPSQMDQQSSSQPAIQTMSG